MTARPHLLWVQELLASRGIDALVDVKADGTLTFTAGAKSKALPATDLTTRNLIDLADQLEIDLDP